MHKPTNERWSHTEDMETDKHYHVFAGVIINTGRFDEK